VKKTMNEKWEDVCDGTQRLGVAGGWLYRVAGQLAFVPATIEELGHISESLGRLVELVEEATRELGGAYSGVRAFRMVNAGD
jgi:hypothetical protein